MFVAGIPIRDDLILELARLGDDDHLAERLESAYGRDVKILGLSIPERETIIRALEDPPAGLEDLRGVLLAEHASGGNGKGSPELPLSRENVFRSA